MNMQDAEAPCLNVEAPGPRGFALGHGGSRVWDNNQQEEEQIQDDEPQADEDDDNQPLHQPQADEQIQVDEPQASSTSSKSASKCTTGSSR